MNILCLRICLFALIFGFLGCAEPPERIHRKLETVLQNDLKYIVGEIARETGKAHLLDEPYFVVREFKFFQGDTARTYAAYAVVDFHYFKGIGMYQTRKYRYNTYRYWDRYYKKVMHAPLSIDSINRANSVNFPK